MRKFKGYLKDFVYPFVLIILASFTLSFLVYFLTYKIADYNVFAEANHEKRLDGITKILGISISITGFVSIIITVVQSKESIQRHIQQNSVDLFKELRNEKFNQARQRAWLVKEKWYSEEGYKERLISHNFSGRNTGADNELDTDAKVVYQLLEFYLLVSVYEGNTKILKSLRYFYYGWWRHFLYDFACEVESNSKVNTILRVSGTAYLEDISYISTLRRLDRLCGLDTIPPDTVLHFDGG